MYVKSFKNDIFVCERYMWSFMYVFRISCTNIPRNERSISRMGKLNWM